MTVAAIYPGLSTRHGIPFVLSAALLALALLPAGRGPHPIPAVQTAARQAAGPPSPTLSFYVYGSFIDVCGPNATAECPVYADAAREAIPASGGMTILDFGAPCFEPATLEWGTQLFNSQGCTPDSTLQMLAQAWLRGYVTNPNHQAGYVLALGTSNSLTAAVLGNALSSDQMSQHGEAWFKSLISPIADMAQTLSTPVTIWAGDDIEESSDDNWYDGPTTSAWVDAYTAASGATKPCLPARNGSMVDFGDYVPNQPAWSLADVYHVAWGAASACPVPEIYNNANAAEWQSLNDYAFGAGLPQLQFTGVMSEDGAGGSLTSSDSWHALKGASGQAAPFTTVIETTGPIPPEVPDAPSVVTAVPGPGLVKLSWSAPAWDGGAAVVDYTVTIYAGSVRSQQMSFTGFPAPETVTVAGLTPGVSYRFYVKAANRVGNGPDSLPSASVAPSGLVPDALN